MEISRVEIIGKKCIFYMSHDKCFNHQVMSPYPHNNYLINLKCVDNEINKKVVKSKYINITLILILFVSEKLVVL